MLRRRDVDVHAAVLLEHHWVPLQRDVELGPRAVVVGPLQGPVDSLVLELVV